MEAADYLRAALAFAFTLSLIGLVAWLVGRYGRALPGLLPEGKGQRLSVLERRLIDGRHQLVLLRRDGREHLVILSGHARPVVVERDITPPALPATGAAAP